VLTLAIQTSTRACGVALAHGTDLLLLREDPERARRHAEVLTPLIASACADVGLVLPDVERIVVDLGPGGFTGLRVGLASARALGWALGIPVLGVSSLDLVRDPGADFLSVLDAGSGVYWAGWGQHALAPAWGRLPELIERLGGGRVRAGGTGARALAEARDDVEVCHTREPTAADLVRMAEGAGQARALSYLRPHYATK